MICIWLKEEVWRSSELKASWTTYKVHVLVNPVPHFCTIFCAHRSRTPQSRVAWVPTFKYDAVFGAFVHFNNNVLFPDLTVAVFGQDWECKDLESNLQKGKRWRSLTTIPVKPSPEQKKWHTQPQPEKKGWDLGCSKWCVASTSKF